MGPPPLRFWELNLGFVEMYAPRGQLLVSPHGTFAQGGPGESGATRPGGVMGWVAGANSRAFCCCLTPKPLSRQHRAREGSRTHHKVGPGEDHTGLGQVYRPE